MMGRRGRRCKQLPNDLKIKIMENEQRNTISHTEGDLFWKRLLTCRDTDCMIMMMKMMMDKNNIKLKPYRIIWQHHLTPHNG